MFCGDACRCAQAVWQTVLAAGAAGAVVGCCLIALVSAAAPVCEGMLQWLCCQQRLCQTAEHHIECDVAPAGLQQQPG